MNSLELLDKKLELQKKAEEIFDKAKAEGRILNEVEERSYNDIKAELKKVEADMEKNEAEVAKPEEIEQRSAVAPKAEVKTEINKTENRNMKNFSLLKEIDNLANGRKLSDEGVEVVSRGKEQMMKAGQSVEGALVIPIESRELNGIATANNEYTANTYNGGKEAVQTDVLNILDPLYHELVFTKVGATYMSGLVGNIQIPNYSGSSVAWEGEVDQNTNGTGTFGKVTMSPKRLSATIEVSKQFLIQQSADAEAMLRRDIVKALNAKLEQTILGNAGNNSEQPDGLIYVANSGAITAAPTADLDYAEVIAQRVALEESKFTNNISMIVSPSAKGKMAGTFTNKTYGSKDVLTAAKDYDYNVVSTGNCPSLTATPAGGQSTVYKNVALYGDFSELIIGQWGGIDIVVDPLTKADKGIVRLVVNAYFDAKLRRPDAVKAAFYKN